MSIVHGSIRRTKMSMPAYAAPRLVIVVLFLTLQCLWQDCSAWAPRHLHHAPHQRRTSLFLAKRSSFDLDSFLQQKQDDIILLLVDVNNVRGKSDFVWTHVDFLMDQLPRWQQGYPNVHVASVLDHGSIPQVYYCNSSQMTLFWAGPHQTADDVLAQLCVWSVVQFLELEASLQVVVITSDGELRSRCLRSNVSNRLGSTRRGQRRGMKPTTSKNADDADAATKNNNNNNNKTSTSIHVFASPQLVRSMEQLEELDIKASLCTESSLSLLEQEMQAVEHDLRVYEQARPPWSSRSAKEQALASGPWKSQILQSTSDNPHNYTKVLGPFAEKTWHRVLLAESMRRLWKANLRPHESSPPPAMSKSSPLAQLAQLYQEKHDQLSLPASMFQDHRLDSSLQRELLQYLQRGLASVGSMNDSNVTAPWTPVDEAAFLLQTMVTETPDKTQDQLLKRYMKEAPSHLQFTRQRDLQSLFLFVCQKNNKEKRWYVKEDMVLSSSLSSARISAQWHGAHPGGHRRRRQRTRQRLEHPKEVEEAWLELETKWLDQLSWNKK